ncbi:MAG: acyl-CoA desaturase [Deltaproteobacteria bacterium]|nr:acyl-CoA desaturase [Deltaproteobacteria bacterium]
MLFVHAWAVWAVIHTGVHAKLLAWGIGSYYIRMVGVTLGYHRYFSHRTFKTSRPMQFLIAFLAMSSMQKGVLWWASHHRWHHKYSDTELDVHSPMRRGFWYSHIGWIMSAKYEATDYDRVGDLAKYPELRFLNKFFLLPPLAIGAVIWVFFGFDVFLWAGIIATAALWHGTFTINSLSHVYGTRPYKTTDTSRNNFLLALITCGEGWHNNHHHYQSTANQGWHWWQLDVSYYIIRILQALGLVWDVRTPPRHVVESEHQDGPLVAKIKPVLEKAVQAAQDVAAPAASVAEPIK